MQVQLFINFYIAGPKFPIKTTAFEQSIFYITVTNITSTQCYLSIH